MSDCPPEKKMNGKGAVAVMSMTLIAVMMAAVWSSLDSSIESATKSVATLERLTNQRLVAMETIVNAPIDREDNPIRHTEAINTLQGDVDKNDTRSEERRQETVASLKEHESIDGHPKSAMKLTAIEEKLIEVETQFRNLDRFVQLLWQRTYDEPLPNPPEK